MAKMPLSHRTRLSAFVLAFIALAGCTNPHSDLKLAPTAHTSPQLSAEDRLWISSTVGAYERCAGVYDAGALVQAAMGNPGAAQNLRDLGNGAEVTSWTLAIYFLGSPKDNAVAGAADRRKSQGAYLMGMLKAGNQAGFLEVFNQCQSVYGDIQTAVTDAIHAWMNSGAKDPAMFTDLLTQALKNGANRQGSSEGLGS